MAIMTTTPTFNCDQRTSRRFGTISLPVMGLSPVADAVWHATEYVEDSRGFPPS